MQNGGAEAAMEWVLSHMEDPDFNTLLPGPSAHAAAEQVPGYTPDPESLVMLNSMGFTERQVSPLRRVHSIQRDAGQLRLLGDVGPVDTLTTCYLLHAMREASWCSSGVQLP